LRKLLVVMVVLIGLALSYNLTMRAKLRDVERGTDIVYRIQPSGNATVEMREKIYFTKPEYERNYDVIIARQKDRPLDVRSQETRVRQLIKRLAEQTGYDGWKVVNFKGRLEKNRDYGARVLSFDWYNFARPWGSDWVVDYRIAGGVSMNEKSSFSVVLPWGAEIIRVEPGPDERDGLRLTWRGPREMTWPYVVFRLPESIPGGSSVSGF